jgi:Resolvase, N terminal domain
VITASKAGFPLAMLGRIPPLRTGLMLTVLGGLAEFERDLIRTRTGEGRARAVARGQKMGRPPKLTPHQQREAIMAAPRAPAPIQDTAPIRPGGTMSSAAFWRLVDRLQLPDAEAIPPDDAHAPGEGMGEVLHFLNRAVLRRSLR